MENKKEFFEKLEKINSIKSGSKILFAYFDIADAIGHLSFGEKEKMEEVYRELEEMVKKVKARTGDLILVISDHGMKAVGRYGDHTKNGFYSFSKGLGWELKLPKITEFYDIIKGRGEK